MTRIERIQPSLHKKDRVLVYLTGGDLAALPQKLQSLGAESLPHAGAKLV